MITGIMVEKATNEILRDYHKEHDSAWIAIRATVLRLMYNGDLYEECALELFKEFAEHGRLSMSDALEKSRKIALGVGADDEDDEHDEWYDCNDTEDMMAYNGVSWSDFI